MLRAIATFLKRLFFYEVPAAVANVGAADVEAGAPPEKPTQVNQPNVFATGTFEHVTLYDLVLALVHGNKNGKVDIQMGRDKAMMLILSGRLVTALYKDSMGDEAVLRIFKNAEDHRNAEFFVTAADPLDFPESSYTVRAPTDKLLFDVAMALDEQRQAVAA